MLREWMPDRILRLMVLQQLIDVGEVEPITAEAAYPAVRGEPYDAWAEDGQRFNEDIAAYVDGTPVDEAMLAKVTRLPTDPSADLVFVIWPQSTARATSSTSPTCPASIVCPRSWSCSSRSAARPTSRSWRVAPT
ncbi:DUF6892 domain-containing protein [Nannocystis pusilla]|uniref:DUF6892 domain-containing protein n=1 Tax=Nannocystis pusilla TaxID=889268 RepID=UPI003B775809